MKDKAIPAVEAGLDDPSDSYKRGALGIRTLEGLGELGGIAPAGGIVVEVRIPESLRLPKEQLPAIDTAANDPPAIPETKPEGE